MTDLDLRLFATFERLQSLDLRGLKVTDLGTAQIARMKKLRSLDLSETGVTSKGLENIAALPDLRQLRLSGLKHVDDTAIPYLLRIKQLEEIDLSRTAVTDAGLQRLLAAPGLQRLFLGGSKVSKEAVELAMKDQSRCQVTWFADKTPSPAEAQDGRGKRPAGPGGEGQAPDRTLGGFRLGAGPRRHISVPPRLPCLRLSLCRGRQNPLLIPCTSSTTFIPFSKRLVAAAATPRMESLPPPASTSPPKMRRRNRSPPLVSNSPEWLTGRIRGNLCCE